MRTARNHAAQQVNSELLAAYWNIGRVIVENEQKNSERAEYGKETLRQLSRTLTKEFEKAFLFQTYTTCVSFTSSIQFSSR